MVNVHFRQLSPRARATRCCLGLLLLLGTVTGCNRQIEAQQCSIQGPAALMPEEVGRIHLGMSKASLEALMGEPAYSPTAGQYYFSTGGKCPLDEERFAACGVVADFQDYSGADSIVTDSLQSCWWGAIGE